MSLQFSDTTNNRGILQLIDANCKTNSTSYPTTDKTRDVNLALDRALQIIFDSCGTWQFDDGNNTDYPIITTNLVSAQRDYSFTSDGSSNLILDIYKVFAKDNSGVYHEIDPVDVVNGVNTSSFTDGNNTGGQPIRYDKLGNGIFLDPVPNYNSTAGLKIYINREASYFTTSDTTKKAGFAGLFHEYLALRPSYQYAYRNSLSNVNSLQAEMLKMEQDLATYYSGRTRDERRRITPNKENNR